MKVYHYNAEKSRVLAKKLSKKYHKIINLGM